VTATMAWTPLRPGQTADCFGCGREMAGARTARERRIQEHSSNGYCKSCSTPTVGNKGLIRVSTELDKPLGHWRERAACRDADPALFEEHGIVGPTKRVPEEVLATALKYCQRCPVLAQCRAEADGNQALRGLLGGVYRTLNMRSASTGAYRTFDLLSDDYLEGI